MVGITGKNILGFEKGKPGGGFRLLNHRIGGPMCKRWQYLPTTPIFLWQVLS
jgi:hypothetical protein